MRDKKAPDTLRPNPLLCICHTNSPDEYGLYNKITPVYMKNTIYLCVLVEGEE